MDPQRWQQIEELYHAVLARTPEERSPLLDRADPETRREVELTNARPGGIAAGSAGMGRSAGRYGHDACRREAPGAL